MSPRRVRRGKWRWLAVAALAAALVLWRAGARVLHDETDRCARLDREARSWARAEKLRERTDAVRRETRSDEEVRWTRVERAYWLAPQRSLAGLSRRLRDRGAAAGLKAVVEPRGRHGRTIRFLLPGGREAVVLSIDRRALVALCLDDLGYRWEAAKRVAALPCPLTGAVIPGTPHARATARLLRRRGKEAFVHMPMASARPMPDVPEYATMVQEGQEAETVAANVRRALAGVPRAAGLNNHEGSQATEDARLMAAVMPVLRDKGLVFLDSLTTFRSVAWREARRAGVRRARRSVFLDDTTRAGVEHERFSRLLVEARRSGTAVGIGHPHAATLAMLEARVPAARREGFMFVPVSVVADPP